MFRLSSRLNQQIRFITSKSIERPHAHTFYDDKITTFTSKPVSPVNLSQLVRFGQPPLSKESLRACTQYAQTELPVRLARRVRAFQSLPFIVGTNPHIKEIYNLYYDSFESLYKYSLPNSSSPVDDEKYIDILKQLVERHSDNIPTLARGFLECKQYMDGPDMARFLDDMIQARIGIRLIAEQAIALMHQKDILETDGYIGVIDTRLNPERLIRSCCDVVSQLCEFNYGQSPEAIIDGYKDTQFFTYVPVHLEYIMTELLKNSYRATVEHHRRMGRTTPLPPIQITISYGLEDMSIRIRDQGNGISDEDLHKVFEYSYTTVTKSNEDPSNIFRDITETAMQSGVGGPIAGLGFGLPLARMYARYFGGSLTLVSMWGFGCDVFLKLRHIDDSMAKGVEI